MKYFYCLLLLSFSSLVNGQDSLSLWHTTSTKGFAMYLHLEITDGQCKTAQLSVPSQSVDHQPADYCHTKGDSLYLQFSKNNVTANISLKRYIDSLTGNWTQKTSKKITFTTADYIPESYRPQTPTPPYNYQNDTLKFLNQEAGIQLSGILSIPDDFSTGYTAILVSGSGPSDWNQEILGHQNFRVIADYLASRGIAVFRYHDRGVGSSEGNHNAATSIDLAKDALSALKHLKTDDRLQADKIGIIGHSEGGIIAPMVASIDSSLAFIISLAGPGEDIDQLMVKQNMLQFDTLSMPSAQYDIAYDFYQKAIDLVVQSNEAKEIFEPLNALCEQFYYDLDSIYRPQTAPSAQMLYMQLIQLKYLPWYDYFFKIKPSKYWAQVDCPVLALQGEKDIQVTAEDNIKAIEDALNQANNKRVTTQIYPDMNHLFQSCKTCTIEEYKMIPTTIEPIVINDIVSWIKALYDGY